MTGNWIEVYDQLP